MSIVKAISDKVALQEIANLQNQCLHFREILQEGMIISELESTLIIILNLPDQITISIHSVEIA